MNGEEIQGTFYEQELQKTHQDTFRIEKVIKTKGNKVLVKWKGYSDDFNSWIDKSSVVELIKLHIIMILLTTSIKILRIGI